MPVLKEISEPKVKSISGVVTEIDEPEQDVDNTEKYHMLEATLKLEYMQ